MAGGAPGGHHGLPHADDHGHFPEEEILNELGDRSFRMAPHDRDSIKEIEQKIHNNEHLSHDELHDYQHFLEHLSHHLKHILQEEHGNHIHNMQLEKDLRKVAQLLQEVTAIIDRH